MSLFLSVPVFQPPSSFFSHFILVSISFSHSPGGSVALIALSFTSSLASILLSFIFLPLLMGRVKAPDWRVCYRQDQLTKEVDLEGRESSFQTYSLPNPSESQQLLQIFKFRVCIWERRFRSRTIQQPRGFHPRATRKSVAQPILHGVELTVRRPRRFEQTTDFFILIKVPGHGEIHATENSEAPRLSKHQKKKTSDSCDINVGGKLKIKDFTKLGLEKHSEIFSKIIHSSL